MIKKTEKKSQVSMFISLKDTLDQKHSLSILAERINWQQFEEAFSALYCVDNGRPALPIRLMVGLLILKHLRNISDESVVEQYSENVYYQYLCGQSEFVAHSPCQASESRISLARDKLVLEMFPFIPM
jgi:IS5 family transposase